MKTSILTIFVLCIGFAQLSWSQSKVFTFSESKDHNIDLEELDKIYKPAIGPNSVFQEQTDEFKDAYRTFVKKLGNHLLENGMKKGTEFTIFSRLYFDKNGAVEYWFYNPMAGDLPAEDKLKELFNSFAENNSMNKPADVKYSQCSPLKIVL